MNAIQTACEAAGGLPALASAIGVTPPAIHQWVKGQRPAPAERCPAIERATRGQVTCEEMRPDVCWHRVPDAAWPWHPDGRPLIDVSRQEVAYAA